MRENMRNNSKTDELGEFGFQSESRQATEIVFKTVNNQIIVFNKI